MALEIGSPAADAGLAKEIFTQVDLLLSPPLLAAVDGAKADARPGAQQALEAARDGWRKLSFAVAKGVVDHVVANLEIGGVTVSGTVSVPVSGSTGPAAPNSHVHGVSLAPAVVVALSQDNDGTGRVR
ncbi:hypothetical protein ACIBG8_42970 [Nonomuraea sp. NPDC050556]|uniref:hypothetical protein n=1 Tax=Nonomuraea sp. NPDC050556 TaxID=3364369 RepID=UPI0037BDCF2F